MYKPNIKLTERARVVSPHLSTDWNRRSIKTYFMRWVTRKSRPETSEVER